MTRAKPDTLGPQQTDLARLLLASKVICPECGRDIGLRPVAAHPGRVVLRPHLVKVGVGGADDCPGSGGEPTLERVRRVVDNHIQGLIQYGGDIQPWLAIESDLIVEQGESRGEADNSTPGGSGWATRDGFAVAQAPDPDWVSWWREQTEEELEMLRPKVRGYGAHDLAELGRHLELLAGRPGTTYHPEADEGAERTMWHTQVGIHIYLVGKLARWAEAIRENRPVSRDTLVDLAVYARMALRVADCGAWPGNGRP